MSHCKTIYRLTVAALATTALAAPAAIAMPIDPGTGGSAVDASARKSPAVHQDLRTPDAVPAPQPRKIPEGMPTWPVNPEPLPLPRQPAVVPTSGDGGGDWTVPAIALSACLMAGAALAFGRTRLRTARSSAAH